LHRLEICASQYLTTRCWLCYRLPIASGHRCQGWHRLHRYWYCIGIGCLQLFQLPRVPGLIKSQGHPYSVFNKCPFFIL
jgi:hypothetical protein